MKNYPASLTRKAQHDKQLLAFSQQMTKSQIKWNLVRRRWLNACQLYGTLGFFIQRPLLFFFSRENLCSRVTFSQILLCDLEQVTFPVNNLICKMKWVSLYHPVKSLHIVIKLLHSSTLLCSVVSNSFATPWTVACQAPLSIGFSRQVY